MMKDRFVKMSSQWYSTHPNTFSVPMMPLDRLLETPPSNSREMRNRAEKMRRDKLNTYITELMSIVPFINVYTKRVDKTSVLRLTATFLRLHQVVNEEKQTNTSFQTYDSTLGDVMPVTSLNDLVHTELGGFLMLLTQNGKIVYVSEKVESVLGYTQIDLMGHSIYQYVHPNDLEQMKHQFTHDPSVLGDETGGEWRRNFNCRITRSGPRCEPPTYEPVNILGLLRPSGVIVCVIRVFKPIPLIERILEARKDHYITRHLVDGRIINCGQSISIVAGYMSEEVSGLSAFKFMHKEDVRWTMIALRQMYDRGEMRGSSCYRLLARSGEFIYLQTCGFLEVDCTGAVESFICINSLVSEEEGKRLISEMKARYSVLIQPSDMCVNENESSAASVEDPQQLEEAIMHLIHDLPSSSPVPSHESEDCIANPRVSLKRPHSLVLPTTPIVANVKTRTFNRIYISPRTPPAKVPEVPAKRPKVAVSPQDSLANYHAERRMFVRQASLERQRRQEAMFSQNVAL